MNWTRGTKFEHDRFIIGSPKAGTARPDICRVTRVTRDAIYYRNESGMLFSMDPEHFRKRFGHRVVPAGVTA